MAIFIKRLINNESLIFKLLLVLINSSPFNNRKRIKGNGNKINSNIALVYRNSITINGNNNIVVVDKGSRLIRAKIYIRGDNNTIHISDHVYCNGTEFYIEDDNNKITVDSQTRFAGKVFLASIEGCEINIGKGCLFSSNIRVCIGDSHSIIDANGKRINASKNVTIGDRVWIGYNALINKGALISKDSVIGAGSIVTKPFYESNVIIAGNPAKKIKDDISWVDERIKI